MFMENWKYCLVFASWVSIGWSGLIQNSVAQQLGGVLESHDTQNEFVGQNGDTLPAWQYKAKQSSGFVVQNQSSPVKTQDSDTQLSTWNPWSDTKDGSQRGSIGFDKLRNDGSLSNSYIFVYYDNFSINKSMTGDVRCSMRFVVTTTLDRKLNNLSMKLKWPEMETAMTFQNIMPNVDAYQYYTLLGEGCYSMDKIPNIIVNRCRVADMSAQSCASKIRWLRKR